MERSRRKAATVLHEMERSLGEWLMHRTIALPSSLRAVLHDRWEQHRDPTNSAGPTISELVAECYLDELLELAVFVASGTPNAEDAKRLRRVATDLGLVRIRNVVAHPVRPFALNDWYSVAAIATDPAILKMGLSSIAEMVEAAESGRFVVEESDLQAMASYRPQSNVPARLDHDLTGLIGYVDELKRLQKILGANKSQVAVIHGFPGAGKTALLHQVLRNAVIDHHAFPGVNGVVLADFADLDDSIGDTDSAVEVIRQLENLLFRRSIEARIVECQRFVDVLGHCGSRRIIFGIDNADILLWRHLDPLLEWLRPFPSRWQFVLTSNVGPLELPTIRLDALTPQAGIQLARECLRSMYGSHDEEHAKALAYESDHVPGVIVEAASKLGSNPDPVAAARDSRYRYLNDSYGYLMRRLRRIEATAIEAAFAADGWLELATAAGLMHISIDEAMYVYEALTQTPFVRSQTMLGGSIGQRRYALTDTASFLLARRPLDLGARSRMLRELHSVKSRIVKAKRPPNGDPFAYNAISPDEPADVRDAFNISVNALYGAESAAGDWMTDAALTTALMRIDQVLAANSDSAPLLRMKSLLLARKGAYEEAEKVIRDGLTVGPIDKPSLVILGRYQLRTGRVAEAKATLSEVCTTDSERNHLWRSSPTILEAWLRILEVHEDWDDIHQIYESVELAGDVSAVIATRFLARAVARQYRNDGDWVPSLYVLNKVVIPAIDRCFRRAGYPVKVVDDVMQLFSVLPQFIQSSRFGTPEKEASIYLLDRHLLYIASSKACKEDVKPFATRKMQAIINCCRAVEFVGKVNPFRQGVWAKIIRPQSTLDEALAAGYIRTVVKTSPRSPLGVRPPFVITSDRHLEFFVTIKEARDAAGSEIRRSEFMQIRRGATILVRSDWARGASVDRAIPVVEAIVHDGR